LAKFCEIPWKYQNSAEKGKFRGSARNSETRRKLWTLRITQSCTCSFDLIFQFFCHTPSKTTRPSAPGTSLFAVPSYHPSFSVPYLLRDYRNADRDVLVTVAHTI